MPGTEKKKARDRERMQRIRAENIAEICRLRALIRVLLVNDPDETIADNGMTVLDEWRIVASKWVP